MEEYEKQYPLAEDPMYDMYDYDDKLAGPEEEALVEDDFDSDDALFFDNNDLANRIWEDND
jgi:hypothetical protein